jgi:hypothetical protein
MVALKKLMDEATVLCDTIFNSECYGVHDCVRYQAVLSELEERGVAVHEVKTLSFELPEERTEDESVCGG